MKIKIIAIMLALTLTSCMKCETWVTDMDGYRYRVWRMQKSPSQVFYYAYHEYLLCQKWWRGDYNAKK